MLGGGRGQDAVFNRAQAGLFREYKTRSESQPGPSQLEQRSHAGARLERSKEREPRRARILYRVEQEGNSECRGRSLPAAHLFEHRLCAHWLILTRGHFSLIFLQRGERRGGEKHRREGNASHGLPLALTWIRYVLLAGIKTHDPLACRLTL